MTGNSISAELSRSGTDGTGAPELVWYAAYGSNADPERLSCYLTGATPDGAVAETGTSGSGRQPVRGCRDRTPPARSIGTVLPGVLYFATESAVWTGGRAFYDPATPAETPARAYLLTRSQFSDIAAQEMYRPPGSDLDLTEVLRTGRSRFGPGRYETLVCSGSHEGVPIVTCTADRRWRDLPGNPPAPAYLLRIAIGLRAAHGWSDVDTAGYLATRPGAAGYWTPRMVAELLRDH
ncbi:MULTISPECIES: histone deacetylase [Nocardia]|uniref:histone deacetylase n=1 Tax=Nocardia TaxID=1817 RepID=UPI001895C811|nr:MULTISPECIES: histone deacetylase [Nocardia]MBF6348769.1 histone deacetylase [Nocardia flavorosea]